ncbi:hypothetical protein JTB14_020750 [Gonioctena quinquepunctata]|nr:hypothetical protein JTB14_020750 [Gonioctena quinquepunctata]
MELSTTRFGGMGPHGWKKMKPRGQKPQKKIQETKLEKKKQKINHTFSRFRVIPIHKIFTQLQRITAWCMGFISNIKNIDKTTGHISAKELEMATVHLVMKMVQQFDYSIYITQLKKGKQLHKRRNILNLKPYPDGEKVFTSRGKHPACKCVKCTKTSLSVISKTSPHSASH